VSYDDAHKFCAWLSQKEGRTYRLPTDREWSIAVGIGDDEQWTNDATPATVFRPPNVFPWGTQWPPPNGSGNYSDQSLRGEVSQVTEKPLEQYDDGFPTTAPVMSFKPNKFGLYDMGGNVPEWVEDWWDDTKTQGTLRGGAWFHSRPKALASSSRQRSIRSMRNFSHCFRVVVDVSNNTP
jgi:formylglycine-generating enzyme required for sulfatase activity